MKFPKGSYGILASSIGATPRWVFVLPFVNKVGFLLVKGSEVESEIWCCWSFSIGVGRKA